MGGGRLIGVQVLYFEYFLTWVNCSVNIESRQDNDNEQYFGLLSVIVLSKRKLKRATDNRELHHHLQKLERLTR